VIAGYDLNVKNFIVNNNYLGMVRQWQELFYEDNYSQVLISSPDYQKLSESYGIDGYTIGGKEELDAQIEDFITKP